MEDVPEILSGSCNKFDTLVKKPEKFLHNNQDLVESTKLLTKVLYDVTKLTEGEACPKTLPELIIEEFDCEQVWAGVELQNQQRLGRLETKFAAIDLARLGRLYFAGGKVKVQKT